MTTEPPTDQPTRCTWRPYSPSSGASSSAWRSSAKSRIPPMASTGLASVRPKPRRSSASPWTERGSAARVPSQNREVDRLPCTKTTGVAPASPARRTWVASRLVLIVSACTSTPFDAVVDERRHRGDHVRRRVALLPEDPMHAEEVADTHQAVRQCLCVQSRHLAGAHGGLQATRVPGRQPPVVAAVQLLVHELRLADDPVEVAVGADELEEGAEPSPLDRQAVALPLHRLSDVAAQVVTELGDQLGEDRLLVREVDVEGPLGHARSPGDVHDRGTLETLGAEHLLRGVQQPPTRRLPPRRHRHRRIPRPPHRPLGAHPSEYPSSPIVVPPCHPADPPLCRRIAVSPCCGAAESSRCGISLSTY